MVLCQRLLRGALLPSACPPLALPCRREQHEPADTAPSQLPSRKTSEYKGHACVPACPAPAIHPQDRVLSWQRNPCAPRQWYQEGWELPRLL